MEDTLLDDRLKRPFLLENKGFNVLEAQTRSREKGMQLRRSDWMTLLSGYLLKGTEAHDHWNENSGLCRFVNDCHII